MLLLHESKTPLLSSMNRSTVRSAPVFWCCWGVGPNDTEVTADKLADKICNLRVFEDENEKMNLNLEQVGGSLLVVSQFTLYADTSSRRPGFSGAAKPDLAIPLYERFMAHCRERGFDVQHGEFGADMQVYSQNDGPVTILFDTEE